MDGATEYKHIQKKLNNYQTPISYGLDTKSGDLGGDPMKRDTIWYSGKKSRQQHTIRIQDI